MYGIPSELDISKAIGQFTTQICVGQFDIQFELGDVNFLVQSRIQLMDNRTVIAEWHAGKWPESEFLNVMNVEVVDVQMNEKEIKIVFANGIAMNLYDDSSEYECILIQIKSTSETFVI